MSRVIFDTAEREREREEREEIERITRNIFRIIPFSSIERSFREEDVTRAENISFALFRPDGPYKWRKTFDDRSLADKATDRRGCHGDIGAGVVFVSSRKSHLRAGVRKER